MDMENHFSAPTWHVDKPEGKKCRDEAIETVVALHAYKMYHIGRAKNNASELTHPLECIILS